MAGIKPKPKADTRGAAVGGNEFGTKRRRDEDIREEVERHNVSDSGRGRDAVG